MKNMLKDTLILMIITLFAGLLLGFVYDITKEPIAQQKELAKMAANKEVFAEAEEFQPYEAFRAEEAAAVLTEAGLQGAEVDEASVAMKDGNAIGYVITVTDHEGYGGDIQFSLGITREGTLNGMSILSISETAGLGMRAEEVLKPQFANKTVDSFTYTKTGATSESQIDAISGATITTNAVTNGVNAGLIYFQKVLKGGNGQ